MQQRRRVIQIASLEDRLAAEAERLRIEAERASDDCVLLTGTPASDYAAHLLQADELVTTERPHKPVHRSRLVHVVYLYADVV